MTCFLAEHGAPGPCEGRLVKAHLIGQNRIAQEFPLGAYWMASSHRWAPLHRWTPTDNVSRKTLKQMRADPATWVMACGGLGHGNAGHHGMLDSKAFKLPREAIPAETERWARAHSMSWYLDAHFGLSSEAAA